ncbi:MAG TPA: hypothetical protein VL860_09670 [Planctomycetota bacterium]|nr:hypothetical protein [Planctomycetota bacterium]
MEIRLTAATLRSVALAAFALVLVGLIGRRLMAPSPAWAATDSPANGVHLVPNEHDQLVIYDTRTRRVLTYAVVNGTDLRLRGWRDLSNDGRVWDSSLLKPGFAGIETKNGAPADFLRPGNDPKIGSMMATQAEQRDQYRLKFAGPAGEDVPPPAGSGK